MHSNVHVSMSKRESLLQRAGPDESVVANDETDTHWAPIQYIPESIALIVI
jgi:hypothetical protein